MASRQPFKLFNVTQKLTTWSIRINKFLKHRLLSKRKHVLLISSENSSNIIAVQKNLYVIDQNTNQLVIVNRQLNPKSGDQQLSFQKVFLNNLHKTWQVSQIKSINEPYEKTKINLTSSDQTQKNDDKTKQIQKKQDQQPQREPSTIVLQNFTQKTAIQALQKHWTLKKKYFDSIVILPEKQEAGLYPQISDQAFATTFISTFEEKIMKNVVAYRFANKFLNTSGTFIQSVSEYDFLKKSDQEKRKEKQKKLEQKKQPQQEAFSYAKQRPPASKQLINNTLCYLGVVVGDRDYTDLNSWTLVSLGEQASWRNPTYAGKMYYDWADGQHLPMPGSFALFKKKIFENKKELDFIQYL